jgi:hypothetical protein
MYIKEDTRQKEIKPMKASKNFFVKRSPEKNKGAKINRFLM